ncbi:MAG: PLP-dependent transferase [Paludibacteraceae bacterium]|nr:PLP-dependent transferase [Paludibacteraceae bacterium]
MAFSNNIETALIHGGISLDKHTGAVNVPIYQTSTFKQDGLGVRRDGWEYARTGNPTRAALEALIADLDGGVAGFAFSSGMAAISAVLSLLKNGDRVLISSNVYGGTFRILDKVWKNFGISYAIADTENVDHFEANITPDTKAVLIESPANPLLTVTDIQRIAEVSHKHGLLVIVDNTFMTPYLQQPLKLGADIVVYSATKYLGGHSDVVAGLVVTSTQEQSEKLAFIQNATGGVLGPFDSFLLQRGIKTLSVRLDRHVSNAEAMAEFLQQHPAVKKLYYPGLHSDPGFEVNRKQAKNGGAMISFELDSSHYDIQRFFKSIQLVMLAESLGGVESLVCHPASMTHASIPKEIREKVGITDGLIRLSIGIENIEDIIEDIKQAIDNSLIK